MSFQGVSAPRGAAGADRGNAYLHVGSDLSPLLPNDQSIILCHRLALPHALDELAAAYDLHVNAMLAAWDVFPIDFEHSACNPITITEDDGVVVTPPSGFGLRFADNFRIAWLEKSGSGWHLKGDLVPTS